MNFWSNNNPLPQLVSGPTTAPPTQWKNLEQLSKARSPVKSGGQHLVSSKPSALLGAVVARSEGLLVGAKDGFGVPFVGAAMGLWFGCLVGAALGWVVATKDEGATVLGEFDAAHPALSCTTWFTWEDQDPLVSSLATQKKAPPLQSYTLLNSLMTAAA